MPRGFVVQQHDATTLHYDLRLEVDGVLRSWAVPKGPSDDPADKRLAVEVGDHEIADADFEGVRSGGAGTGAVIIWDAGHYRNLDPERSMAQSIDAGHVKVWLEGEKLQGGWTLQRTGGVRRADWLLMKRGDDPVDGRPRPQPEPARRRTDERSVRGGRTLAEVADPQRKNFTLRVGLRSVSVSHPEKALFTNPEVTKLELARYYEQLAGAMIPHLRGRPLALQAFPDGIGSPGFFLKSVPKHFPDWIHTVEVPKRGGTLTQVLADDAATLVYLAGQNVITPHIWLSRADLPPSPDRLILDFDPSPGARFADVRAAAREAGARLRDAGLATYPMLTGSRGVHVVCPLRRGPDFSTVHRFARTLAEAMVDADPRHLTLEWRRADRGARIYVDVNRNAYAQHVVAPYGVRPRPRAPVAMPIEWDELSEPRLKPDRYTVATAPRRLESHGDAWQNINRHARSLPRAKPQASS
ncbi:MAG: non-homologous end-joining DNA ligase [Solirubrobacteraceae bacterium]